MGLINYCNPGDPPEEILPEIGERSGRVATSELSHTPRGESVNPFMPIETFRDQVAEAHEEQIRLSYLQGRADMVAEMRKRSIAANLLLVTLALANLGSVVVNIVGSSFAETTVEAAPVSEASEAVGKAQKEVYHALNTSQNLIHPVAYCGPDLSIWGRIGKPVRCLREGTNAPKMCVRPSQFQMLDDACDLAKAKD